MEIHEVVFESARDNSIITRINKKIAFPRGFSPRAGDRWKVTVCGTTRSGTALFVSPVEFVENINDRETKNSQQSKAMQLEFAATCREVAAERGIELDVQVDALDVCIQYKHQVKKLSRDQVKYDNPNAAQIIDEMIRAEEKNAWWFTKQDQLDKMCGPILRTIAEELNAFEKRWGRFQITQQTGTVIRVTCSCPQDTSRWNAITVFPPQDKIEQCIAEAKNLLYVTSVVASYTHPDMYDWEGDDSDGGASGYRRL